MSPWRQLSSKLTTEYSHPGCALGKSKNAPPPRWLSAAAILQSRAPSCLPVGCAGGRHLHRKGQGRARRFQRARPRRSAAQRAYVPACHITARPCSAMPAAGGLPGRGPPIARPDAPILVPFCESIALLLHNTSWQSRRRRREPRHERPGFPRCSGLASLTLRLPAASDLDPLPDARCVEDLPAWRVGFSPAQNPASWVSCLARIRALSTSGQCSARTCRDHASPILPIHQSQC
mmetsp:Transcript_17410/g.32831  ORF Transcript_17410/g.32831 Transcript_17410/m.32831 type:complete len:234 (-) Transcript_17410:1242-1943(-)